MRKKQKEDQESLIENEDQDLADEEPNTENLSNTYLLHKPLSESQVLALRQEHGKNIINASHAPTWYGIFFSALFHPFNILLAILAAGSAAMDDLNAMGIMLLMIFISLIIRFVQEFKSALAAQGLKGLVTNKVKVIRMCEILDTSSMGNSFSSSSSNGSQNESKEFDILIDDVVPGDWVKLSAGDLVPGDLKLIESKDLYISQSSLTGEANPVEKYVVEQEQNEINETQINVEIPQNEVRTGKSCGVKLSIFFRNVFGLRVDHVHDLSTGTRTELDSPNFCFMGTSVVSGTGIGLIQKTGKNTYFGRIAYELSKQRPQNAFQLGVRRISWIFFLAMICLVPPIFILQGFLHGEDGWYAAALFALSAAVGLTPEMLPMIVSSTLARGAYLLSKKKSIVKNLDSIINLGGMDILCTDKTGTLTENKVTLFQHVDSTGVENMFPLQLAFLNSHFQSGLSNLMDTAIGDYFYEKTNASRRRRPELVKNFTKVDELPFDFVRRRMSVLLKSKSDLNILVTKGAVDEMLQNCSQVYIKDESKTQGSNNTKNSENLVFSTLESEIVPLADSIRSRIKFINNELNENGLRVIAVAYKIFATLPQNLSRDDETELVFCGFIAFQDPPKASTLLAIKTLMYNNVEVKVLTGDSATVCKKICKDIDLPVNSIVSTTDLEGASEEEICNLAEFGTIFAKLTPLQKAQIVRALKSRNHVVGFLGDGINDANALVEADIGISVDNGTDIARESADIILLEKDLMVITDGVSIGRQTYGNTLKYIVMAISSNFGNAFSLLVASAWFPFTPILPIQMLTQNLLYDISQTSIPWDNMDEDFLKTPHRWSMKSVLKFMLCLGPWSSVFDITFFSYMYFYYGIHNNPSEEQLAFFRTTWFNIGILTQTFIVHMLRTPKIPFVQSMASVHVTILTTLIIGIAMALPYIPLISKTLEFIHLPLNIYPFILGELLAYCLTTQLAKMIYVYIFKEWY